MESVISVEVVDLQKRTVVGLGIGENHRPLARRFLEIRNLTLQNLAETNPVILNLDFHSFGTISVSMMTLLHECRKSRYFGSARF